MHCPHCNQEHPEDSGFCPVTGRKIVLMSVCPECGKPVEPSWQHCPSCGRRLVQADNDPVTSQALRPLKTVKPETKNIEVGFSTMGWLVIIMGGVCSLLVVAAFVFIFFWNRINQDGLASPLGGSNAIPYTWINNGPEGGNIRALAVDPVTPTILYAGSDGHGVFKSTDSGENWSAINNGLTDTSALTINVLAIDPTTPSVLYAGTDSGVFKSADGGGNWLALTTGMPEYAGVRTLALDPLTPATIYVVSPGNGIFKSTDGGQNWSALTTNIHTSGNYISSLAIDPVTPTTLYAGTYEVLLKSTDGGETWRVISSEMGSILSLAIDPTNPATLYAGTGQSLFKSADGGETWNKINATLSDHHFTCLLLDPATPLTLYAAVGKNSLYSSGNRPLGIFKSVDGGVSWNAVNDGLTDMEVYSLAIFPASPAGLYAGTYSGVFKSADGGLNWSAISHGMTAITITSLTADPSTPSTLYAGAGDQGVFKSTDSGDTWEAANTGLTAEYVSALVIDPTMPTTLYAVGSERSRPIGSFSSEDPLGVFKSMDGGESWGAVNGGLTDQYAINALAIDPLTPTTLYAVTSLTHSIFKSINGGDHWSALDANLPRENSITSLMIDPMTPTTLYLGTYGGVLKSNDSGETWDAVNNGLTNDGSTIVKSLAIDPLTPTTLYAGLFANGIFKSMDGGENWSRLDASPSYTTISILAFNSGAQTILYAIGTDNWEFNYSSEGYLGIFQSMDGGQSWQEISTGELTNLFVHALLADPEDPTTLLLGTTRGVFKGAVSGGGD